MQIGSDLWRQLIVKGAAEYDIDVTPLQADQFARHAGLLLEWNRKINLTAIVDPVQVAVKHYLDALIPLTHIPHDGPLLDVGTGAGFPGLVLKIMRPDQPMALIDGSRKKISFIKTIIRQLGLPQIEAIQIRAEDLDRRPGYHGFFKVVVSRATADVARVERWTKGLLAAAGQIILYLGPGDNTHGPYRYGALAEEKHCRRSVEYRLPCLGDPRKLLIVELNH